VHALAAVPGFTEPFITVPHLCCRALPNLSTPNRACRAGHRHPFSLRAFADHACRTLRRHSIPEAAEPNPAKPAMPSMKKEQRL
jgi:hypothetical protein